LEKLHADDRAEKVKKEMKKLTIILLWFIVGSSVYSQNAEYKKFYLSIKAGLDYSLGTSNTVLDADFDPLIAPFAKKGFGGTLEGAYFFTPNYGIGMKYHLFSTDCKDKSMTHIIHDLNKKEKDVLFDKYTVSSFDEITHIVGPALFGRWNLGETKLSVLANVGVGYVYNKLSKIEQKIRYLPSNKNFWWSDENAPRDVKRGWGDLTGTTFGATYPR
jgi:hypothetical protein